MSSPSDPRCSFCRLSGCKRVHRSATSPAWPCLCERQAGETESAYFARIGTPVPTRARSVQAPARRRQRKASPDSENDDTLVAFSPLHHRSTNAFASGLFTPKASQDRENAAIADLDDDVVISPFSSISDPATPDPSSPVPLPSPASTQIVPETPLSQSYEPDHLEHEPTISPESDYTNHIGSLDQTQLLRSRRQAITELDDRTAQIDRLILRGQIEDAKRVANQALLRQTQINLIQARLRLVEMELKGRKTNGLLWWVLVILTVAVFGFAAWREFNFENRIYIRARRRMMFGLRDERWEV